MTLHARRISRSGIGAVALLLALAGCASPPARYYVLTGDQAVPGGERVATAVTYAPSVAVGPVSVPALVDRPQLVLGAGGAQVRVDEFARWAAPLADQFAEALAAELSQQLVSPNVWVFGRVAGAVADRQVSASVQRFEIVPGREAVLELVWTVQSRERKPALTGRSLTREPIEGIDLDAAIAAQRRALRRASEDIARALRQQP